MFKDLTETTIAIAISLAILAATYAAYGSVLTELIKQSFTLAQ